MSQLCMVMSYACLGPKHSPNSYYQCNASDISAEGIAFNVFGYGTVLAEQLTITTVKQMRYVLCQRVFIFFVIAQC